jgi:hypothetical protein
MPSFVHRAHADFAHLAAEGADGGRVAERAFAMWGRIEGALVPIIGQRGFAALLKRSLLLASTAHAALADVAATVDTPGCLAALRATLGQQSGPNAIAAHAALLQTFCDLLAGLIGESLTERLLHPVQDNPSSDGTSREQSS